MERRRLDTGSDEFARRPVYATSICLRLLKTRPRTLRNWWRKIPLSKCRIGGALLRETSGWCLSVGEEGGKCRTYSTPLPTRSPERF